MGDGGNIIYVYKGLGLYVPCVQVTKWSLTCQCMQPTIGVLSSLTRQIKSAVVIS